MKGLAGILLLIMLSLKVTGQQQSVNVNGTQIYYSVRGSGAPVLVFHGWLENGDDWQALLAGLEDGYQLIYVDLPGHGKTGRLPDDFSIQGTARLMKSFMLKLELRGARAIGFSYGGMLLLEILAADPAALREAVLISTPYVFSGADQAPVQFDSLPGDFQEQLIRKHAGGESQVRALFNPSLDYNISITDEALSGIYIPILLISGKEDPLVPEADTRRLHSKLDASRLWVVGGKGHMAIDDTNADTFISRIREFFRGF